MLSVYLDCSFLITLSVFSNVYWFVCFRPVSCVPNVASVSGCSFLITPSVFSNVYLFVCFRPVSCVPNVVSVSGLFILDNTFSFL